MNKFIVLNISDSRWSEVISNSVQYDFYHTQSYSLLEEYDEPVLFVAFHDKDFIAFPLIIRNIEGTGFYDCTSVYGYCGPVSNQSSECLSREHISYFQSKLLQFFKHRNIVSVFSRLNPIINQSAFLSNFGTVREVNNTVVIDLRISEEQQKSMYRKSHRMNIEQSNRSGYIISEGTTKEEIDIFIQIYLDSMKKINADSYYLFKREYFYHLLDNPCFKSILLLAKKKDIIVAGAIFTLTQKIMQYHLSASRPEYRKEAPMKNIIDQARMIGNKTKMDFLHLGGGYSGSSEDSLFFFKAGFSDYRLKFSVWQLIIDELKYNYLIDFNKIDRNKISSYFPAYRAMNNQEQ